VKRALLAVSLLACTPAVAPAPSVDTAIAFDAAAPPVDPDGTAPEIDSGRRQRIATLTWYEAPKMNGNHVPDDVSRVLKDNFGRFRLCYEPAIATNPSVAGFVLFELTVDKDGSVSSAKTTESEIADAKAIACLLDSCKRLVFPKPADGKRATLTFHIRFTSAEH
jgi:hypothetical protein